MATCPRCSSEFDGSFTVEFPPFDGKERIVTIAREHCSECAPQVEREQREAEALAQIAKAERERAAAVAELMAVVPPEFLGAQERDLVPEALAWAAGFEQGELDSLLLTGPVGTGKTHTAWALWRMLAAKHPSLHLVYHRTATLLDLLRPDSGVNHAEVMHEAMEADLLYLDDIGVTKPSEWVTERLLEIVDERYIGHQPLLLTSNLAPMALSGRLGARLGSRLAQHVTVVALSGPDRRRAR